MAREDKSEEMNANLSSDEDDHDQFNAISVKPSQSSMSFIEELVPSYIEIPKVFFDESSRDFSGSTAVHTSNTKC